MSCKSDRVRRPTEKAVTLPLNKGPCSREPRNKALKSKGKRARSRSSVEDETQLESDRKRVHTSKRSNGKQRHAKRARCSSPDTVVKIEEATPNVEEIEVSSHTGGDEHMDNETDDEDVSTPANWISVY